jgi:Uma2 family endonuclease
MDASSTARRLYDWKDYRSWPDDQRWEIIGGEAYAMSPAPSLRHQTVVGRLHTAMARHFSSGTCSLFLAPVDVKLSDEDVVQPDLVVACDPGQLRGTHVEGAPSLVVEVISPSTHLHDRKHKIALYERYGVGEVWLVTPYPHAVEVFLFKDGAYRVAAVYGKEDTLTSPSFPKLRIPLRKVFDFPLEPGERIQMVREGHPPYAVRSGAREKARRAESGK